jgi:hypothetical protein
MTVNLFLNLIKSALRSRSAREWSDTSRAPDLPFIRENKMVTLLLKIYESGETEIAERIYQIYMQNGYFFVKDFHDKNK